MNKHDYKQNAYYLMYLIRCVLNDKIPAKEKLDKMNLSGVFAVAKAHSLSAIAAYALESAGIYDNAFEEEKNKAIRKEIILNAERERVLAKLEKAGIWYMPLKGIIIKDLYPQIGMRQMCDNDVLFDKAKIETLKHLMISLGFTMQHDDFGHDIVFTKQPLSNFEMHTALFGVGHDVMNKHYDNIESRLIKDDNNHYGYHFSIEDFYVFMIAHEHKHYNLGGTGLRSLVDTYVYIKNYGDKMDMQYIQNECQKLRIAEYEKQNRKLAMSVLKGKKLTDDYRKMLDYIVFSGTYGNVQNRVNNKLKNEKSSSVAKIILVKNRLLVPIRESDPQYKAYAARYKWFYKSKARAPLLFFYRIGAALMSRRSRVKAEIKAVLKAR